MEIKIISKNELEHYLSDFCGLYRKCFSDYIDENIVRQRYIDNPYEDLLMCFAIDNGSVVANYSTCPCEVMINGKKEKAAISLNTMTDPEYEGQGLFGKLATVLYSFMKKNNYALVYGFPNFLSNKTFTSRLGWKDIYEVPTLEREFSGATKKQETGFARCPFEEIGDKRVTANVEVLKDKKYLNWRFNEIPEREYFFAQNSKRDWVIYKYYQDQINVIETDIAEADDVYDMFRFFENIAIDENKKSITVWSKINSKHHYCYERLRFINKYPVRYFAAAVFKELDVDVFDYRNWLISMGDDNVY